MGDDVQLKFYEKCRSFGTGTMQRDHDAVGVKPYVGW